MNAINRQLRGAPAWRLAAQRQNPHPDFNQFIALTWLFKIDLHIKATALTFLVIPRRRDSRPMVVSDKKATDPESLHLSPQISPRIDWTSGEKQEADMKVSR